MGVALTRAVLLLPLSTVLVDVCIAKDSIHMYIGYPSLDDQPANYQLTVCTSVPRLDHIVQQLASKMHVPVLRVSYAIPVHPVPFLPEDAHAMLHGLCILWQGLCRCVTMPGQRKVAAKTSIEVAVQHGVFVGGVRNFA